MEGSHRITGITLRRTFDGKKFLVTTTPIKACLGDP